ncbi:MAG: type VI secretion system tip protein VgrG [Algibacter sp.]
MGVVTATIKSDGEEMSALYVTLSIDVSKEFNKVPTAELRFIDGIVSKKKFNILDGGFFDLGKEIEVALKYEGKPEKEETIFIGIVMNQSLELNKFGTTLTIEMSDKAIKMTNVRKNAVYKEITDSEIIKKQIEKYNLKKGPFFTKTAVVHDEMIQYYATDWDFMVSRAEANGLLVSVSNGEVSVFQPKIETPSLELELGKDQIYDFDLKVNGGNQYHKVTSVGWDSTNQKFTEPAIGNEYKLSQKKEYNISKIATAVGAEEKTLIHAAAMDSAELKAWSDGQIFKSRFSFIRGWFKIPGSADVKVGQTIKIIGVGNFEGQNIISGVRHEVTIDGWVTHLQIGMDSCWFSAQPNVTDIRAAGLLPGVNGLQIGIVEADKEDPKHQFRIRVMIPALGPEKNIVWARLASIDAGMESGVFFKPKKDDEVIVGFLNDDPRQAVILGSVHSSNRKTPAPFDVADEKKNQKGIFIKSEYKLLFDEDDKGNGIITLSTSKENQISIDESKNIVSLSNKNGNKVELNKNEVIIISAGDCQIKVKGNLDIEAEKNISIKGSEINLI